MPVALDTHAFTDAVLTSTDYRMFQVSGNWLSFPTLQMGNPR